MDRNIDPDLLLKESVKLETQVAELYLFFAELYPEDATLWRQLHDEEKNHAVLLDSIRGSLAAIGDHALKMLSSSMESLRAGTAEVNLLIKKFKDTPPPRETAFRTAIRIEESTGEHDYQKFMDADAKTPMEDIFRQLNKNDKDHAARLRAYIKKNRISLSDG